MHMQQCVVLLSLLAVVSIHMCNAQGDQGDCIPVGQFCAASLANQCCPPNECQMTGLRSGTCVKSCYQLKAQCQKNEECCSKLCIDGQCGDESQCIALGQSCTASMKKKCCPPYECKMSTLRSGTCIHNCLKMSSPCQKNEECCSNRCFYGQCLDMKTLGQK
ncbi:unnamed protein product [Trichobilharzia szidati]|nr:unnamed protein product [Trichobilharzia szidati]